MSDQLNPAAQAATLQDARPKIKFTIPESERLFLKTDPHTVVMRPITLGEEERAATRAAAKKTLVSYEMLKEALYQADDKLLTWDGPNSREVFLDSCSPTVRDLLLKGYAKLHLSEKEPTEAFLASMVPI